MKPTLEEVKEYFENAEKIKDHSGDVGFPEPNKFRFTELGSGIVQNVGKENWLVLWNSPEGFAKILTTKEKTFTITAEQLRQLTDPKLKQWFPEVFKVKLEVGKWYKYIGNLCVYIGGNETFGFWNGEFRNNISFSRFEYEDNDIIKATEQEVFEALKNESEKIGYKKGNYKCLFINDFNECEAIEICYDLKNDTLWLENGVVYKKGVWAKIIPTCTRKEAEKLLNKKIID